MKTRMLIFMVVFVLLVTACGQPTALGPTALSTAANVTITWLVRPEAAESPWNIKVITEYRKLHPEIKINAISIESGPRYLQMFEEMTKAGTPPDVWSTAWGGAFNDYARMGVMADLTPLIQQDRLDLSDFLPETLKVYTVNGKIMGLPFAGYGNYIYYNKDVFDQAGVATPPTNWDDTSWTWDTFVQKCQALTQPSKNIFGCLTPTVEVHTYQWLWGKDLFPGSAYQTGFSDTAYLDDPLAIQARQAERDLIWKYKVAPDSAQIDSVYGSYRYGMAMPVPGFWEWIGKDSLPKNWGMAALPNGTPGRRGLVWIDAWMLSNKSAHPNEAWEFFKYLASPEVQRDYMATVGATPARASLLEEWYKTFPTMTPEQVRQVHLGSLKYGSVAPENMIIGWDEQLYPIILKADQAIWKNEQPVADILHAANQELINKLKQIQGQ
jgi:multiple sugar transport system substrate-binding protein